jgi:peptidoglycan/LPS O-acetylase OafA/YrhL
MIPGPSHPRAPRRYVALDSLRGVAACMVVLLHVQAYGLLLFSPLVRHGWLFVDFFFVLSGFVIAANYSERLKQGFSLLRYMVLRLGRVWPLHMAILLAALSLKIASFLVHPAAYPGGQMFYGTRSFGDFLLSALLLHVWQGPGGNDWNTQSWSISIEVFLYLAFALLWFFAARASLWLAIGIAIVATILRWYWLVDNTYVIRGVLGFSYGVLVWEGYSRFLQSRELPFGLATALEALLVLAAGAAVWFYGPVRLPVIDFIFALAVLVFAKDGGLVSAVLARRLPVLLGTLSYSIYMIHLLLFTSLRAVVDRIDERLSHPLLQDIAGDRVLVLGPVLSDVVGLAVLAGVCALAAITYRWIEQPARSWSRRKATKIGGAAPASKVPAVEALTLLA